MLRVLHLSDLHFHAPDAGEAAHHAFRRTREVALPAPDRPFLRRRMIDEIFRAVGKPIHGLVVTGDLTYRARPAEFDLLVSELSDLLKKLELGPDRLLLIPGNHDADWSQDKAGRFSAYRKAFRELRGHDADESCHDELLLTGTGRERVRFIGVNSCLIESKEHAGMGKVGDEFLSDLLDGSSQTEPLTATVLCLHHHLLPVSYEEREYEDLKRSSVTLDAKAVLEIAQRRGVDIILHGHQHQPNLAAYGTLNPLQTQGGDRRSLMWLAGAGSAGAVDGDLGQANKRHFQVLSFDDVGSHVHCTLQAYTSHNENNQEFAAGGNPIAIHLGFALPTGPSPHLKVEETVLQAIRGVGRQSTAEDQSDLFVMLLQTRHCVQVNEWLRKVLNDDLRIDAVYDLYGDFDLLVKIRTPTADSINKMIIAPLSEERLIAKDAWGKVINIYRERYPTPRISVPIDEASHCIKAFVHFPQLRRGDSIAETCSEIASNLGTRTIMSGAYSSHGGTELIVEYLVACGAYYELSAIVTAIESRMLEQGGAQKVTLLAQRAWEQPLLHDTDA